MSQDDKAKLYRSWRESPAAPPDWRPKPPPGALDKVKIHDVEVMRLLRNTLPGGWVKVYHRGVDGTEMHYCQHESGMVALVKHKIRR